MKIVVNQKNFKKALGVVEKVVAKNTTLPILNNILFKTENGRLRLSATNLEIGINYIIGAKIEEVGQVAVPARIISDFAGNVSDEKIRGESSIDENLKQELVLIKERVYNSFEK